MGNLEIACLKISYKYGWGYSSLVGLLASICKDQGSIYSTTPKKCSLQMLAGIWKWISDFYI